jgi:hypothetical protein
MGQPLEDQRRIEEEKLKALQETEQKILEGENRLVFDYGGWVNFSCDDYDDDDNDSLTADTLDYTHSLDYRLWLKATLRPPADGAYPNEHSLYIRLKDFFYLERTPSEVAGGYDHDGPHLDYGYLVLDFRPWWTEIGRRYYSVGQGIAYSNVNDGVELYGSFENWNLKMFYAHTLPHEDNIDTSVPGYDKESDRDYYGLEATYLGISNHGLYGFVLVQRDESDEAPNDEVHEFTYDSEYIGLGSQGKIIPKMHYWAEVIRETGESYIYDTREQKDIDAWAVDCGITYDWDVYSQPNISVEYAFGSGDSDRTSVTDTEDGNTSGDDTNFLYFGYLPGGYALSPRLSNLHFYKTGVLFKPLEKWRFFRNLSLGADYYWYYKDKKEGGIYDTDATLNDRGIGTELDLMLSWQILSDLTCSFQYGHFMPGDAYPDETNDTEDYFSTGVSFTF